MVNKSKIIEEVVEQDLCIGCGLCSGLSNGSLAMKWNKEGFLVAEQQKDVENDDELLQICPYNPFPQKEVKTEDEIANIFLKENRHYNPKIGRYERLYAGHSKNYRKTSSSGGLATYVFNELLEQKIVDAVLIVREGKDPKFYEYGWLKQREDVISSSKTRYYPVSMDKVIKEVMVFEGKIAIVGVACFLKGIRLLQHQNPKFRQKIAFLVGIICGGLKSKYYTDYLASETIGKHQPSYTEPEYRIKDPRSSASDYSFGCKERKTEDHRTIKMQKLGDMWGTGLFKANACDFCEDVAGELADISLGDAWLEPYVKDGLGTNVVITRSKLAEEIVQKGLKEGKLELDNISESQFIQSQRGSYNHRHNGLKYRIEQRNKNNKLTPPKRERNLIDISYPFRKVQYLREQTRSQSLKKWRKSRDASLFDRKMFPLLKLLNITTKVYHKFK